MRLRLAILAAALAMPCAAFADRQANTEYECEQLASQKLGVRCKVWRFAQGKELLMWFDEGKLSAAEAKKRSYLVTELLQGYADRGDLFATQRRTEAGEQLVRSCAPAKGQKQVRCTDWNKAQNAPGPEWQDIVTQ